MHQCLAGVGATGTEGEIREEGLRLAHWQRPWPRLGPEHEAAQEPQAQIRHGACLRIASGERQVKPIAHAVTRRSRPGHARARCWAAFERCRSEKEDSWTTAATS